MTSTQRPRCNLPHSLTFQFIILLSYVESYFLCFMSFEFPHKQSWSHRACIFHPCFTISRGQKIAGVQGYLYSPLFQRDIRLAMPGSETVNSSYIYSMDLLLPEKREVLKHLKEDNTSSSTSQGCGCDHIPRGSSTSRRGGVHNFTFT